MDMEEINSKRKQLRALNRRLHEREEQLAIYGISVDPAIKTEIQDIKSDIRRIEQEIAEVKEITIIPEKPRKSIMQWTLRVLNIPILSVVITRTVEIAIYVALVGIIAVLLGFVVLTSGRSFIYLDSATPTIVSETPTNILTPSQMPTTSNIPENSSSKLSTATIITEPILLSTPTFAPTSIPTPKPVSTLIPIPKPTPIISITYQIDIVNIPLSEIITLPGCQDLAPSPDPGQTNNACIVGPSALNMEMDNLVGGKYHFPSDARQIYIYNRNGNTVRITILSDNSGSNIENTGNNKITPQLGQYYKIVITKLSP